MPKFNSETSPDQLDTLLGQVRQRAREGAWTAEVDTSGGRYRLTIDVGPVPTLPPVLPTVLQKRSKETHVE